MGPFLFISVFPFCRCLHNKHNSSTLLPLCRQKRYYWRYQYHDVTVWSDRLIQFGPFTPAISWTATLPQPSPLPSLREQQACRASGFTIADSGLWAATCSWSPGSQEDNIGDMHKEVDRASWVFLGFFLQLTASNHCRFLLSFGTTGVGLKLWFTFTGPSNQHRGRRVLSHRIQALFISFNCC